mmetsp:Transcript_9441/g.23485  ORF Transcript_9441/g.23485 Transcript_9441/m.23485 type:complete len:204 (+) Transcript_9441:2449-3060(+)
MMEHTSSMHTTVNWFAERSSSRSTQFPARAPATSEVLSNLTPASPSLLLASESDCRVQARRPLPPSKKGVKSAARSPLPASDRSRSDVALIKAAARTRAPVFEIAPSSRWKASMLDGSSRGRKASGSSLAAPGGDSPIAGDREFRVITNATGVNCDKRSSGRSGPPRKHRTRSCGSRATAAMSCLQNSSSKEHPSNRSAQRNG